jgi:predicted MFS family arabinose efflux permease
MGAAQAINMPARQSLGPDLAGARHVADAVALNSISFNTSRVAGPALAGVLLGFWGMAACFWVQAAGQVWAMAWTLMISGAASAQKHRQIGGMWANGLDGLSCVKNSPLVLGLVVVGAIQLTLGLAYIQFLPAVARDVLQVGPSGLGMLMSAVGAGSLVGSVAAALFSAHPRKGVLMFASGAVMGVGLVLFGLSQWLALSIASLALVGVAQAVLQAMHQTLLMLATPGSYRGRVMSVFMMTWGASPLVLLPAGWLADAIGAPMTILLSGVLLVLALTAAAIWLPGIRGSGDDLEPQPLSQGAASRDGLRAPLESAASGEARA